jgi:hypothetical protein
MKKLSIWSPVLLVAAILLGGMVLAGIYQGNYAPITLRNNDDNSQYSGLLVAYGDVSNVGSFENCFEVDNGLKPATSPSTSGFVFWQDGNNYYNYFDSCTGPILHEFACSKNVKYVDANGGLTQYHNLVALVDINCNAIGFSTCNDSNAFAARCA